MWQNQGYVDNQINAIFNRHDYNRSGFLDVNQLTNVLNELYTAMNSPIRVNNIQAQQVLYQIDRNGDGRASRKEVKKAYRHILDNPNMYGGGGGGFGQGGFQQGGFNQGGFNQGGFQQGGFGQGGFQQGGFGQGGFGQSGFGQGSFQQGTINLGGGGFGNQGGFTFNGTWSANNDQYLQSQIDMVYARYDRNMSGQLEQNEFFPAYSDLCLAMNQPAPQNRQGLMQVAQSTDTNFDGRVSKMEMYNLFKRVQFSIY